jgi:hypothetical protein
MNKFKEILENELYESIDDIKSLNAKNTKELNKYIKRLKDDMKTTPGNTYGRLEALEIFLSDWRDELKNLKMD